MAKTKTRALNKQRIEEFKKSIGFNQKLGLDHRDNIIISILQKNPRASQQEIAEKISLSQPSVGARIRKLEQKGILAHVNGVNFKHADLNLAKIDVNTSDAEAIIKEFKHCPFFLNALLTSGRHNLCLLFTATNLKRLEGIVNYHLRSNPKVKDIEMNVVITTAKDLVLPLNIDYQDQKQLECAQHCKDFL